MLLLRAWVMLSGDREDFPLIGLSRGVPLYPGLENAANQAWALGEALVGPSRMCLQVPLNAAVPAPDFIYHCLFSLRLFS